MPSWRVDHDSWPHNGHREAGESDARYRHSLDRDLYDRHGSEAQRAYVEGFDREQRRIEERKREEREEEERAEQRAAERRAEERRYQEAMEEEQWEQHVQEEMEALQEQPAPSSAEES
jgi:hypothetical protein